MNGFSYLRPVDEAEALHALAEPDTVALAGGTTLVDLMRLEVMRPKRVVDLGALRLDQIDASSGRIAIGALASNTAVADHPEIEARFPALAQAIDAGASRARFATWRASAATATPKAHAVLITFAIARALATSARPGSGLHAAARRLHAPMHAVIGGSSACIITHPIGHVRRVAGTRRDRPRQGSLGGERVVSLGDLPPRCLATTPTSSTLRPGELITAVEAPGHHVHQSIRATIKVRDRASYAFALASAAIAAQKVSAGKVADARVALGGVATKPWRERVVEHEIVRQAGHHRRIRRGRPRSHCKGAETRPDNAFKVELAGGAWSSAHSRSRWRSVVKPSVGTPIDRVDARRKVTGTATYAADTDVTKVAHAVIMTSAIAKGTIIGLDVDEARRAPGVLAVITHGNAPRLAVKKHGNAPNERVLQLLQDAQVVYADQPIAIVVADTLEHAQHTASLIVPQFAPRAVIATIEQQLGSARAPKGMVHGEADSSRGNFDVGIAAAKLKLDATYATPNVNHNPLEPHATIAVWTGSDRLTLYDATQGIFGVRQRMSEIFSIPKDHVRVIDQFVGGGFGCKGTPWSHVVLAALAAKVVKRPVKLAITRQQMFSLVGHRPHTLQHIVLGADPHGKLLAIDHAVTSETSGSSDEFVEPSALQTRMLYSCPNVRTSHRLVSVDAPTPTFMRAPGESSGTFAIESGDGRAGVPRGDRPARAATAQPCRPRRAGQQAVLEQVIAPVLRAGGGEVRLGQAQPRAAIDAGRPRARRSRDGDRDLPRESVAGERARDVPARRHVPRASRNAGPRHRHVHRDDADSRRYARCPRRSSHVRARRHRVSRGASFGRFDDGIERRPGRAGCMCRAQAQARDHESRRSARLTNRSSQRPRARSRPGGRSTRCTSFGADFVEVRVDQDLEVDPRRAWLPRSPAARSSTRKPRTVSSSAVSSGASAWRSKRTRCETGVRAAS